MASISTIRCVVSIKNGYLGRLLTVFVPYSKMNVSLLSLLLREGIVQGFVIRDRDILVTLLNSKFVRQNIRDLLVCSKPSKPVFISLRILERINSFMGSSANSLNILNTSGGLVTLQDALRLKVGGELLFASGKPVLEIIAHR